MELFKPNIESIKAFLDEASKKLCVHIGPEDAVPHRIGSNFITDDDFESEVLDWVFSYSLTNKAPDLLACLLARAVADDALGWDRGRFSARPSSAGAAGAQESGQQDDDDTTDILEEQTPASDGKPLIDTSKLGVEVFNTLFDVITSWAENLPTSLCGDQLPVTLPCCTGISVCAVRNGRRKMEDKHTVLPYLNALYPHIQKRPQLYMSVFDGHGGSEAACYSSAHLHHFLLHSRHFESDPVEAVRHAYAQTDTQFITRCRRERVRSGCTALVALVRERTLYLSWLGDSQALLVKDGRPVTLMTPHKPEREDERKRIEEAGGFVVYLGAWRVNATLSVSRAIGDADYKPYVSGEPDIVSVPLSGDEDYLIMACDGLWDTLSYDEVVMETYNYLHLSTGSRAELAFYLTQRAKEKGSTDNITVVVVFLRDELGMPCLEESSAAPIVSEEDDHVSGSHTSGDDSDSRGSGGGGSTGSGEGEGGAGGGPSGSRSGAKADEHTRLANFSHYANIQTRHPEVMMHKGSEPSYDRVDGKSGAKLLSRQPEDSDLHMGSHFESDLRMIQEPEIRHNVPATKSSNDGRPQWLKKSCQGTRLETKEAAKEAAESRDDIDLTRVAMGNESYVSLDSPSNTIPECFVNTFRYAKKLPAKKPLCLSPQNVHFFTTGSARRSENIQEKKSTEKKTPNKRAVAKQRNEEKEIDECKQHEGHELKGSDVDSADVKLLLEAGDRCVKARTGKLSSAKPEVTVESNLEAIKKGDDAVPTTIQPPEIFPPLDTHVQPVHTYAQAPDSDAPPAHSHVQPSRKQAPPLDTQTQPSHTHVQAPDSHVQPPHTQVPPSETFQPSDTYVESQSSPQASYSLITQPKRVQTLPLPSRRVQTGSWEQRSLRLADQQSRDAATLASLTPQRQLFPRKSFVPAIYATVRGKYARMIMAHDLLSPGYRYNDCSPNKANWTVAVEIDNAAAMFA